MDCEDASGQSPPAEVLRTGLAEHLSGLNITGDDAGQTITLSDMHGNRVTFGPGGITLASDREIRIIGASFSASGSASAQLNSDGVVIIKGAVVALNP